MAKIKYLTKLLKKQYTKHYKKNNSGIPLSDAGSLLQISVIVLVAIGIIMVFSSSIDISLARYNTPYYYFLKQLLWASIGVVCFYIIYSLVDYRLLQKHSNVILITSMVLLVLVLFIGSHHGGAKRWLNFGPLSFQPSEFAKLAVIIALANFIDRKKSKVNKLAAFLPLVLIVLLPLTLIFFERDLGTPVLIALVALSMLLIGGLHWVKVLLIALSALPLLVYAILTNTYRFTRIIKYAHSFFSIDSDLYQVKNSILAFGSGGILGQGLGNSKMKGFLPEPHTDFIFPIIGEEWGFKGVAFVIILFVVFLFSGFAISKKSDTYFGKMLAFGITILITYQALINMGVSTGVLPVKGLALPFISYGGSSLVFNMIAAGILLNIAKNGKLKQES